MAADRAPEPELPDPDAAPHGPSPLQVLVRRWPLLVLGLLAGVVVGVLIHLNSAPVYQSSSQVLVVRNRAETLQGTDVRVGAVEDYVATQIPLIKSERIRRAAARELKNAKLNRPLPEDERAAAGVIGSGLTVAREKETTGGAEAGSGVLVLTYRGGDPQDTRRVLDAVIKAYQDELYAIYDRVSHERIQTLDRAIDALQAERKRDAEEKLARLNVLRGITNEDVPSIRTRVTALKDKLYGLRADLIDVTDQIALIASAGDDRQKRRAVLAQLTTQTQLTPARTERDSRDPDLLLRALEAQRDELEQLQGLGKDHSRMKALDAQIAALRAQVGERRADAGGRFDDLDAIAQRLEQRKRTIERQRNEFQGQIDADERVLKDAGGVQDQIDALTAQVQQVDQKIGLLKEDRRTTQATQGSGSYSAQPITPPADGNRIAPVPAQSLLMGLAVGLLLGGLAAAVAELTDKSFRSPAEIRRRLGLPVIGHIPQIRTQPPPEAGTPGGLQPTLVAARRPKSAEAEAYRGLRTQLYFSTQGRGHQVVQVTSPNPGDGKSTLAANLAISVAQSGKRVVLVDADFRKPRVHKLFEKPLGEVGLSGVVAGTAPLAAGLAPSGVANLDLLLCGPRPANPAELLTSPRFQELLEDLRRAYDFVIVDTPPLLAVSDPAAVAPRVDGVLLVFRMTKKARPSAERAREQLGALGANVLGVVINGSTSGGRGYGSSYGYNYNYGYNYGYKYADYGYADDYSDDSSTADDEARPLPAKG